MKHLIVGIDGGTAEIFDQFDMPFWQELRRRDTSFDVTEDLNQRGWARMLSGQGAEMTAGLYMYAKPGTPQNFTPSFNYRMMQEAPGFEPVWAAALKQGARIGIMNVPTTSPVQQVPGFYVTGGGGGLFQGGLPKDAVHPAEDRQILEEAGYIFDTRLGAEGFESADAICTHIIAMMQNRTEAYIALARKHEIDFGFLAYRATTVLLYLAMSEIAHFLRRDDPATRQAWSDGWGERLLTHFSVLDDVLARLFDALQPQHHIITSDHSMVPWTHNVDYNCLLTEAGFATRRGSLRNLPRNLGRLAMRPGFRRQVAAMPGGEVGRALMAAPGSHLDPGCRAFSGFYVHGIYINDAARFGGTVAERDVAGEVEAIVEAINWQARQEGLALHAKPYRRQFPSDAPATRLMADITIEQDGHAFPTRTFGGWYERNPNFAPVRDVRGVGGMHSGQKGRHPILMADPALAALHPAGQSPDLRSVHWLSTALFSQTSPARETPKAAPALDTALDTALDPAE